MGKLQKRNRRREAAKRRMSRVQDERFTVDAGLSWHVLLMDHASEHRVRLGLRRLGIVAFVPGYSETLVRKGKPVEKRRLYFSRYVVFGATQPDFRAVEAINGVVRVMRFGSGEPVKITADELEQVAERLTGNVESRSDIKAAMVMLGQLMTVREGPFASFQMVVEDILASGRVRGTTVMGNLPLELDVDQLEAA